MMERCQHYCQNIKGITYSLELHTYSVDDVRTFEKYVFNEHLIIEQYPELLDVVPESRTPQKRGANSMINIHKIVRSFFKWANNEGYTTNDPYKLVRIPVETYGTPYYISIDERNHLYRFNLSLTPRLAVQRYVFVFQCLIGCCAGDLLQMTVDNLINGAVEYVARKTREGRPVTVRVPLNDTAKEIIDRYSCREDKQDKKLLPFISAQNYNYAIKDAFKTAGLTRSVTVINPTTGEVEIRPINELASSHMARRCFIGNLYKQVKDPNLVGALSGHKEGSQAFARYREIDEQMKTDLVKMLE